MNSAPKHQTCPVPSGDGWGCLCRPPNCFCFESGSVCMAVLDLCVHEENDALSEHTLCHHVSKFLFPRKLFQINLNTLIN